MAVLAVPIPAVIQRYNIKPTLVRQCRLRRNPWKENPSYANGCKVMKIINIGTKMLRQKF